MPTDAARPTLSSHGEGPTVLTVLGATGHQEIPDIACDWVVRSVRAAIRDADRPASIVTSLAAGADQLVAQEALALGCSLEVVLPCRGYERTFSNQCQLLRFQELSGLAANTEILNYDEPSEDAFWAAGRRVVERCDVLLAIWDGAPAAGLGGTADVVRYAAERNVRVRIIWPEGLSR